MLWGTAVTLGACTLICALLYGGLALSLTREVDAFLRGENEEFLKIVCYREPGPTFAQHEREMRRELVSRLHANVNFRLLNHVGQVMLASRPHDPWPVEVHPPADPAPPLNELAFRTVQFPGDQSPHRVCSRWTLLPGGGVYEAQTAYPLAGRDASLAKFRRLCFVALALAACLALLCAAWLAGKSLQPVRRMTETARNIGAHSLSERLPRSHRGDEFDSLAAVLNDMLARLERQFLDIQRFTADAAHELRTPLAAVRGNMEVALQSAASTEELRRVLEESIERFDMLSRTANDLLLLARADAGPSFLRREQIVLTDAVRDVVDLYVVLAAERGVELTLTAAAPLECFADGSRLRQAISNLLDNALNHTPAGGTIALTLHAAGRAIVLTVRDSGPGVDPEHLPHIFDRFYRVDAARTRYRGGSGLGLAICRSIVEAHGGRIEAASVPGQGATLTITLPADAPGA